jgi:hypothetical protein
MWTGEHNGKKVNIKDVKAEVKQKLNKIPHCQNISNI